MSIISDRLTSNEMDGLYIGEKATYNIMIHTISNMDDIIDSRDIIERLEELEDQCEMAYLDYDEYEEYASLYDLTEECSNLSADWEYGEQLIRRSYFEQYMDEMIEECYELPKDLPYWMTIKLDYNALEQDYTSIDFDGVEYLIRSV
jgi:predicted mannosyl-3-phosphoglycerate phosphatase (HAD superfamily)